MNSKHTPGSWRYAPDLAAVVVFSDYKIKTVADFGKTDLLETEANARLIAAAPDMAEALRDCIEQMEQCARMFRDDADFMRTLNRAHEVLP